MPVLLGDATDCSRLQYWGLLTDVDSETASLDLLSTGQET
jgi:hypothetical protein